MTINQNHEKKILNEFKSSKAVSKSYLANQTKLHYYIIEKVIAHLLLKKQIKKIQTTGKGVFYVRKQ